MSEGRVCYSLGHDVPLLDWRVECPSCGAECRFVLAHPRRPLRSPYLLVEDTGASHIENCGRAGERRAEAAPEGIAVA